ncbi:hypothetical protein ACOMHN_018784 [Nucella lapillus]
MGNNHNLLWAACLLMIAVLTSGARFPAHVSEDVAEALGQGREDGGLGDAKEVVEEESLPLQAVPDPFLASLDSRMPFYAPEFLPEGMEDSIDAPLFQAPLKRGRYNRFDILKRSRLNQLIHRLLAMRGDRYSYHRASPVRFAAGRR